MAWAGGFSPADCGSSVKTELRIVPVVIGAGNINMAEVLLGNDFSYEGSVFVQKELEGAWETIAVADTLEWDRTSLQHISNRVNLCPPGPHALVLVLPMTNPIDKNIEEDIKAAQQQVELLSERIWKHTMVLFVHEGELDSSTKHQHLKSAEKLLEKCEQRHFVLQSTLGYSQTMGSELLKKIQNMVKENNDNFFIPQVYYELIQDAKTEIRAIYEKREDDMKSMIHQQLSEVLEKLNDDKGEDVKESGLIEGVKIRRGSYGFSPPSMNEGDENKEEDQNPDLSLWHDLLERSAKPGVMILILMALVGALIGAKAEAPYGTLGVCCGIVCGFLIGSLVTFWSLKLPEEKPKRRWQWFSRFNRRDR